MTRFWREEREEGAIYNVYLKKVTYHTLSEVHVWLCIHRDYFFLHFGNGKFTSIKSELEIISVKKKGLKIDQMS